MDDGIVFINVLVCIELCESRNKQRYLWKYRNNPPPPPSMFWYYCRTDLPIGLRYSYNHYGVDITLY